MDQVIRPKAIVLPDSAQLADKNILKPAPNQFTHEIAAQQPYYFMGIVESAVPDGMFPAGTKIVLLRQDDNQCWVADGRGLYVATSCAALRPL